ncbi:MAG: flagellar biosynthesis protein FlhF [Phycisphaeraceae bacterium]|nr:flagellar biosynthesis protein FlhF [Phycisphaeraceae bacterium]
MNLRTYRAASIADALSDIKRDLGPDAVILHTRSCKEGGILGFRARRVVEITASSAVNVVHPLARKGKAAPSRSTATDRVRKAYGGAPSPAPPAGDPVVEMAVAASASADTAQLNASATAQVSPSAPAPAHEQHLIARELASIRSMVGQALRSSSPASTGGMPEALFRNYLAMIESEVARELADHIVGEVRQELTTEQLESDENAVSRAVLTRLERLIPVADTPPASGALATDGRPRTIALVGPTGVGKTTTIAKLAAIYKLRHGKRVGLVTTDTYRIAAVEQLRTYANIIGIDLRVALTPREMQAACAAHADCDVLLIDTAGRSQRDATKLDDLKSFLEAAKPHETHLVLSGASSEAVIVEAAQRFALASPDRVIFTKLDEMVHFGVIVNAARSIGAQLSYVTTGQEVPDHIEPGSANRLARLILGVGEVREEAQAS